MKKKLFSVCAVATLLASGFSSASADGWPMNYEGVMLQGFYWDSYSDTRWTNLESQADELSQYFKLIWIPNSGNCGSGNNMGYMPKYWFTNHNSSFGSEEELRHMIATFREKGTGFIADVVVNHRDGVTNWTDFPTETWNGQTWSIGPEGICCNDEVANASGQAKPTGNYDTGDNFDGCRDLDHTNANVQNNVKNYCKFLLDDLGYAGFRYDMVKGYGGQYTKIYNEYSKPTFSVGEYWDSSYDALAAWINATGKQSAAFDFPCKYAINEAFSSNDMTKLVWKANGTTDQPAGMIHFGYAQYSVTFIDNHDTYRDGSKFNGNVLAANAFILCSPGTPCVFLPHWKEHKEALKTMIAIRNSVGVNNMSAVKVLKSTYNCYMAEVTGSKGKLVVKIGSDMASPDGYSNDDIKASGTDYCIWTKTGVVIDPTPDPDPAGDVYIYVDGPWTNVHAYVYTESPKVENAVWPGEEMTKDATTGYWQYKVPSNLTTSLVIINTDSGSDRYPADMEPGMTLSGKSMIFHVSGNKWEEYTGVNPDPDPDPDPTPDPEGVTVYFDNTNTSWDNVCIHYWDGTSESKFPGENMTKLSNVWVYTLPAGVTGFLFTDGTGNYGSSQTNNVNVINDNHVYVAGTESNQNRSVEDHGLHVPESLYIIGELESGSWNTNGSIMMEKNGMVFTATNVNLKPVTTSRAVGQSYFTFVTAQGDDWNAVNASHRFGAAEADAAINGTADMHRYGANVNASASKSWTVEPGKYDITADFSTMKVSVKKAVETAIDDVEFDESADETVYYNLQGVRVDNPCEGLYIVVRGSKVTKEYIR